MSTVELEVSTSSSMRCDHRCICSYGLCVDGVQFVKTNILTYTGLSWLLCGCQDHLHICSAVAPWTCTNINFTVKLMRLSEQFGHSGFSALTQQNHCRASPCHHAAAHSAMKTVFDPHHHDLCLPLPLLSKLGSHLIVSFSSQFEGGHFDRQTVVQQADSLQVMDPGTVV